MLDSNDADSVVAWHVRGLVRFTVGVLAMGVAVVVTDAMTWAVAALLVGGAVVVGGTTWVFASTTWGSHRLTLLLVPFATIAMVGLLSLAARPAATLVIGLFVLAFLFVGLSQPPWTSFLLLPAAVVVFDIVLDLPPQELAVRTVIAAIVWMLVAEIPARLIADLREKQRQLEILATTDPLTGVLNRTLLGQRIEQAGETGAVVLVDIDHFKEFNDTYGHVAGDAALREFASVLATGRRAEDAVIRYGGEEFLVVLKDISVDDAHRWLDRIAATWSRHPSRLTFSAGIARSGPDCVRQVDVVLYRAKNEGRARILISRQAS